MTSVYRENYEKDVAFVEMFLDIHPNHKSRPAKEKEFIRMMAEEGELNVEQMAEGMLPLLNPDLIRTNNAGMDYISRDPRLNLADVKTSTCSRRDKKQNGYIYDDYKGSIQGVETKLGALLVIVYNEYTKRIDFFHIPYGAYNYGKDIPYYERVSVNNTARGKKTISYSYSRRNDTYSNNLELYRCSLAEMLCIDDPELADY